MYKVNVMYMYNYGLFSTSLGLQILLGVLCFISFICFTTIFLIINRNPKLQAHPLKMFMYVAFLDAYIFAGYLLAACPFKLHLYKLISMTVFYSDSY